MNNIIKIVFFWIILLVTFGLFAEYCINREVPLLITGSVSFIYGWVFMILLKYSVNNLINNKKNKQ
jgi:hypothetical protein